MKASLFLSAALLASLALTTRAQTTPSAANPSPAKAQTIRTRTADQRAATYQGPRVAKDSKALGRKFLRDSKPAPTLTTPVKQ